MIPFEISCDWRTCLILEKRTDHTELTELCMRDGFGGSWVSVIFFVTGQAGLQATFWNSSDCWAAKSQGRHSTSETMRTLDNSSSKDTLLISRCMITTYGSAQTLSIYFWYAKQASYQAFDEVIFITVPLFTNILYSHLGLNKRHVTGRFTDVVYE